MVNNDGPGNDGGVAGDGRASALQVRALGLALVLLAIALAYLLACVWPASFAPDTAGSKAVAIVFIGTSAQLATTADVQLLMLVMVAGALGSFLHTATSFADFVGNEKLARSWLWWYLLKPFIGMGLAVIFYLVVRGGLLSAGTEAGKVNIYGIAALAGLTGMFSKQATDKLGEVFTTLFQTRPGQGDDARKGSLANEVPVLTDVVPMRVPTGTPSLDVEIKGTGFARSAVVRINGSARETLYDSSGSLGAKLVAGDVAQDGVLNVVVFNPPPGGGSSTPLRMTVAGAPQPPSPGRQPV